MKDYLFVGLFERGHAGLQGGKLLLERVDLIFVFLQSLIEAPAAIGTIHSGPDPAEIPQPI